MSQVSLIPVLLWVVALACAGLAVLRGPRPTEGAYVVDRLLRYLFIFPLGLQGLWAFFGHAFLPEQSAASIGWPDSPFQLEVGMANLGIGLASLYAAFKGFEVRLAAALAAGAFLIGDGVIHIKEIAATGNLAPGNAGPILLTDFLTPLAAFVLLYLSRVWRPKSSVTLALEAELQAARKAMREYRAALSDLGKE